MPNLVSAFKDIDCATNVYWGTSAGRSHYFKGYFRGLAYAMSWPLVSDVGCPDATAWRPHPSASPSIAQAPCPPNEASVGQSHTSPGYPLLPTSFPLSVAGADSQTQRPYVVSYAWNDPTDSSRYHGSDPRTCPQPMSSRSKMHGRANGSITSTQ